MRRMAFGVSALLSVTAAMAQPRILDLGVLPGASSSRGYVVNADGTVVAGYATLPDGQHAFRWTRGVGMHDFGVTPERVSGATSTGYAVSGDGATLAGNAGPSDARRAFRWTSAGGIEDLGFLPGGSYSSAYAISVDGATVVGMSTSSEGQRAFRWTREGGMRSLGVLPGVETAGYHAFAVSADGSVVVGRVNVPAGPRPFRWTSAGGMEDLGVLPGGERVGAYATVVSADGSTVAGDSGDAETALRAFRWTRSRGIHSLGRLADETISYSFAINADGSIVVGYARIPTLRVFLWTEATGMTTPEAYLASRGVDLTGWSAITPRGFSADGTAITGYASRLGEGGRAFLVRGLTPPRRCVADTDDGSGTGTRDGGITIDDLLYYLDGYTQSLPRCDLDDGTFTGTPDGGVTIDDLLYYLFRFEAGC